MSQAQREVEDVANALDDISIEDVSEQIDDNSPLHNAASRGHSNYLEALLNAGASPNSKDPYGNTLLHLAAMHGTQQGFHSYCPEKLPSRLWPVDSNTNSLFILST